MASLRMAGLSQRKPASAESSMLRDKEQKSEQNEKDNQAQHKGAYTTSRGFESCVFTSPSTML